jgi:hypothetical protein
VISNPFAGVAPIPVDVPSDPLSGLMAMEVEDLGSQSHGRLGVETICGKIILENTSSSYHMRLDQSTLFL